MTPSRLPATLDPTPAAGEHAAPVRWVDPATLLSPRRLDLVVKADYFGHLLDSGTAPDAEGLYTRHIARRTGGVEDAKRRLADYQLAARALLESIRCRGFDARWAVPLGHNGLPLDGAHRLAACLALGLPVAVRDVAAPGPTWDFGWFLAHDFSRDDLDVIVRRYARHSSRLVAFVFWGPCFDKWPTLQARIETLGQIAGWRDLTLDRHSVRAFVRDLYAYRLGPLPNDRIELKARGLADGPPIIRVVLAEPAAPDAGAEVDLQSWATAVKSDLRRLAGRNASDYFATVHATDTIDETRYVVDLAFTQNSLRHLANRPSDERPLFLEWLARYRTTLNTHGIAPDQACIVGSAVLEAIGLREATDIDCVIATDVRSTRFHQGVVVLGESVDLVTAGYHRRADGGTAIDDGRLVADAQHHFLYRGLKFANPELVIDRKRQHGRPKDLADVSLWEQRARPTRTPRPVVVCWTSTAEDRRHVTGALAATAELVLCAQEEDRSMSWHHLGRPPAIDRLPDCLLRDPDPLATLTPLGLTAGALHSAAAEDWGPAAHPGHAFRRLRAVAWQARWLDQWMAGLKPAALIIPNSASALDRLLLTAVAAARHVPVTASAAEATTRIESCPVSESSDASTVRAVCRQADEPIALLQERQSLTRDADQVEWLRAEIARLEAERNDLARDLGYSRTTTAVLGAAVTRRPVWIWGAGTAGAAALQWLTAVHVRPVAIVDSNDALWGRRLAGLPIAGPDALSLTTDSPRPFVVVASMHADAIIRQLTVLGFRESDRIVAPRP